MVYNSGEDESGAKYLEIAQRSQKLLALLEEKAGAFVVDAYNYQTMDDDGTPLYTMNNPEFPIEIAPAGVIVHLLTEIGSPILWYRFIPGIFTATMLTAF